MSELKARSGSEEKVATSVEMPFPRGGEERAAVLESPSRGTVTAVPGYQWFIDIKTLAGERANAQPGSEDAHRLLEEIKKLTNGGDQDTGRES